MAGCANFQFKIETAGEQIKKYFQSTVCHQIQSLSSDALYTFIRNFLDKYELSFPIKDNFKVPEWLNDFEPIVFTKDNTPSSERKLREFYNKLCYQYSSSKITQYDFCVQLIQFLDQNKYSFPIQPVSQQDEFLNYAFRYTEGDFNGLEFYKLCKELFE